MKNWPTAQIRDVARVIGGGTPTRSNSSYYGGDIPWVTPKDMKRWKISESQVSITRVGLENSTAKLAPAGSVLVVVRSGVLKHTVPVAIAECPVAINQDMKAIICSERLESSFLAHFIKERSSEILQWVRATTADNFPIGNLMNVRIPLPPLSEQRRVVDILDCVDVLRARRRQTISLLEDLAQSIFLSMFGNVVSNNQGWSAGQVKDLVAKFTSGKSFAAAENDDAAVRYRILKVSAVTSGRFDAEESKPVPVEYNPPLSHIVRDGDLIFSRANTESLIGATALAVNPPSNLLLPDKLWRFVWHSDRPAHPLYVRQLFLQAEFRREISRRSSGTSGSMKNISQSSVLSIPCGIPPLELQHQYGKRIEALEKVADLHRAHLVQLDALFTSLRHHMFRDGSGSDNAVSAA
ncbi:restriction endonuclease subunit S [Streptomyces sp. NPDC058877]|uniref:restriction endonuclease subunit S n=1 Tax=Streptomyces sp. NPDC058877 TaxID=3346665 RepID=UPI0036B47F3E